MSRWVDAKYCEDFFDRWENEVKDAEPVTIDVVQNTRTLLRDAPSIDIVRCGECKYYIDNMCDCYSLYGNLSGDLIGVSFEPNEDFFCSYGERKENK